MPDWRATADWQTLKRRSAFFAQVRDYFAQRACLEVQIPILQDGANLDHGVEVFRTDTQQYLITSPEHYLKRLLCDGAEDCFAISPCFRRGESGQRHNPEFYMLEWYRRDWELARLIDECCDFLRHCLDRSELPIQTISYRDAFLNSCGLDPFHASLAELQNIVAQHDFEERSVLLDLCMLEKVEPSFDPHAITVLCDYPADQAAQAQCGVDAMGNAIAHRFEIYHGALELANGYWECTDARDIRQRMQAENHQQHQLDEAYCAALEAGLPACSGVALGLDRVFMLQQGLTDIRQTMAFPQR